MSRLRRECGTQARHMHTTDTRVAADEPNAVVDQLAIDAPARAEPRQPRDARALQMHRTQELDGRVKP
jgi:hypothetical protein